MWKERPGKINKLENQTKLEFNDLILVESQTKSSNFRKLTPHFRISARISGNKTGDGASVQRKTVENVQKQEELISLQDGLSNYQTYKKKQKQIQNGLHNLRKTNKIQFHCSFMVSDSRSPARVKNLGHALPPRSCKSQMHRRVIENKIKNINTSTRKNNRNTCFDLHQTLPESTRSENPCRPWSRNKEIELSILQFESIQN